jgi:hypothetical protein
MLLTGQADGAVQATERALGLAAGRDSDRVRSRLTELRTALAASGGRGAIDVAGRISDRIHA